AFDDAVHYHVSLTHAVTTATHTLPLHDALPISCGPPISSAAAPCRDPPGRSGAACWSCRGAARSLSRCRGARPAPSSRTGMRWRSEEHTSELQSRENLVCRLLLEKEYH